MTELDNRIRLLEEKESVRNLWMEFTTALDFGGETGEAYDPDRMLTFCSPDYVSKYDGGSADRVESHEAWTDMAQSMCIHFPANYVLDLNEDASEAHAHWYSWEHPTLTGDSVFGCFTHELEFKKPEEGWLLSSVFQTTHFFCAFNRGWETEPKIVEQRRSRGA